jgi:hypothetical protein
LIKPKEEALDKLRVDFENKYPIDDPETDFDARDAAYEKILKDN